MLTMGMNISSYSLILLFSFLQIFKFYKHRISISVATLSPQLLIVLFSSLLLLGCADPLGMENLKITAAQISASSQFGGFFAPNQGRLHFKGGDSYSGSWSAGANNPNQWFQIDLRIATNVTFVATQGRHGHPNQRVTQYKLQYSQDELTFQAYKQAEENSDTVRRVYVEWPNKLRTTKRQAISQCQNRGKGTYVQKCMLKTIWADLMKCRQTE